MHSASVSDSFVTYKQAADILAVSTRTIHRLREDGRLEPVVARTLRNGVTVRFRRADVEALLAERTAAA